MTSLNVVDLQGKKKGTIALPAQFDESFRPDIIRRAVISIQTGKRQPYGTDLRAGKKYSARFTKRRRAFRGTYGKGWTRVPKKILSRNGTQMNAVGAFVSGTVGGLRAHPPKAAKIWFEKINNKEKAQAIRSALAASINKEIIASSGHLVPKEFPFVLADDFENVKKTKEIFSLLGKMGFENEFERASKKNVRAGVGKNRGRKYKKSKGFIIVVGKECPLLKSARNLPGIDVVLADKLNAELLAPGTIAGRPALFTEDAIAAIKGGLFQ